MIQIVSFPPRARAVVLLLSLLSVGCGTVNPQADYARVRGLITGHTGAEEVYDPAADDTVEPTVQELLQDGLTVDEAVRVALLNNRVLQAKFAGIGIARADVVQSGLLTNPTLSLGVMLPEGGGRTKLSGGLAQNLMDLWQIPARKKVAEARLDSTLLDVANTAVDLAAQVKSQYYTLAGLQAQANLTQENLALVQHTLDLTQRRFDAGETTILDVHLNRARVLDLQARYITYTQQTHAARAALAHLMGLDGVSVTWEISDSLPDTSDPVAADVELLGWAVDHRLDTQQARADLAAAAAEIVQEKRKAIPDVSVSIDAERGEMRGPESLPFNPLDSLAGADPSTAASSLVQDYALDRINSARERKFEKDHAIDWVVGPGLQITLPVFDQNRAQIAKAKLQSTAENKRYEELLLSVAEEILRSAAAVREAVSLISLMEQESLPLSERNLESSQRLYEAGEEDIPVVLDAQDMLIQQRAALVSARQDYAIALADLERALGGRLTANTPEPNEVANEQ
ncbi:MAG: TolC family protein [Candidatus Hydrogenedentes bacterium]|nr:TolC family protein [Candidatus Hydrogenedentota bacterium]